MTEWTSKMVKDRLTEAAGILVRLPPLRLYLICSHWAQEFAEPDDHLDHEAQQHHPLPSTDQISGAEQAVSWLTWLKPEDAKLVWARAGQQRWKMICWNFGISRATAHRRWEYSLSLITSRLNGRPASLSRSRRQWSKLLAPALPAET